MCLPRLEGAHLLLLFALCLVADATAAHSERLDLLPPALGVTELYAADQRSGLALAGLDPVTYLLDREPRPGSPANELIYDGVAWRFVSDANRAVFKARPDAFLPRLGGYDAVGIAARVLVTGDPRIFAVRAGRVYLFRTTANRDAFLGIDALAQDAEAKWPTLRGELVKG